MNTNYTPGEIAKMAYDAHIELIRQSEADALEIRNLLEENERLRDGMARLLADGASTKILTTITKKELLTAIRKTAGN